MYRSERIDEIREWANEKIEKATEIKDITFRLLCYFSILDSFAQEYANYPTNGDKKLFTGFVLKFCKRYDYLEKVDTVTLYYHYIEAFQKDNLLDFAIEGECYKIGTIQKYQNMNLIRSKLKVNQIEKHRYVDLLYALRSKLVHEHNMPFGCSKMKSIEDSEPFYISLAHLQNGEWSNFWILTFPPAFVKNLMEDCIKNYLIFCTEQQIDPFENNDSTIRKMYVAWYDK